MSNTTEHRHPFLIFSVGDRLYALSIDEVEEVAVMVEMIVLPDSPPELLGMINRHGTILPMLDLRFIFGQAAQPVNSQTLFIIIKTQTQLAGLVVDRINQVEYIAESRIQNAPSEMGYIRAIVGDETSIMQIIALTPLVNHYLSGYLHAEEAGSSEAET